LLACWTLVQVVVCQNGGSPDTDRSDTSARHLRSSNPDRLNEPPARIAIGQRRFSHYAPRICNSLPTTVRSADSYDSFEARLKTHLFDTVWRWRT